MIGRSGERGSGISVMAARDDNYTTGNSTRQLCLKRYIFVTSAFWPFLLVLLESFRACSSRRHGQLSIIWKSDLTDKTKRSFFQAAVVSILLYGCTTWTLTKRL